MLSSGTHRSQPSDARLDQLAHFEYLGQFASAAQDRRRQRWHQRLLVGDADKGPAALPTVDDPLHLQRAQRFAD